jgi:hypothetical protein
VLLPSDHEELQLDVVGVSEGDELGVRVWVRLDTSSGDAVNSQAFDEALERRSATDAEGDVVQADPALGEAVVLGSSVQRRTKDDARVADHEPAPLVQDFDLDPENIRVEAARSIEVAHPQGEVVDVLDVARRTSLLARSLAT